MMMVCIEGQTWTSASSAVNSSCSDQLQCCQGPVAAQPGRRARQHCSCSRSRQQSANVRQLSPTPASTSRWKMARASEPAAALRRLSADCMAVASHAMRARAPALPSSAMAYARSAPSAQSVSTDQRV